MGLDEARKKKIRQKMITFVKNCMATVKNDLKALKILFKSVFLPYDDPNNPMRKRQLEKDEREYEMYKKLKKEYRRSLFRDHEPSEISFQIKCAEKLLRQKARVLTYDFSMPDDNVPPTDDYEWMRWYRREHPWFAIRVAFEIAIPFGIAIDTLCAFLILFVKPLLNG